MQINHLDDFFRINAICYLNSKVEYYLFITCWDKIDEPFTLTPFLDIVVNDVQLDKRNFEPTHMFLTSTASLHLK